MSDLDRDAIKARAGAATGGPWSARTTGRSGGDHWYICDSGEAIAHISANDGENEDQRQPVAEFIAHARTDIPALLAALEEAEIRLGVVEYQRNLYRGQIIELTVRAESAERRIAAVEAAWFGPCAFDMAIDGPRVSAALHPVAPIHDKQGDER